MMVPAETDTARRIISAAKNWLGTPYMHQASVQRVGCDCLGLVRGVWREVYGSEPEAMPAYTPDWAETGGRETLLQAAQRHMHQIDGHNYEPGDLLMFRWKKHMPAKHLAIAVSETSMIHAQEGASVCEVSINNWWRRHLAAVFRFPEIQD